MKVKNKLAATEMVACFNPFWCIIYSEGQYKIRLLYLLFNRLLSITFVHKQIFMEKLSDTPIWDQPISEATAQEYCDNYLNNTNFQPADFTGFYFHRDEIQLVLDQNKDKEFIKFTMGMKQLDPTKYGNKLYGCVMMTSSDVIIPSTSAVNGGSDAIYDFSRPIPPYPETE